MNNKNCPKNEIHAQVLYKVVKSTRRKLYGVAGSGTDLFVKVSRPGDSEVTFSVFKSSCHLLLAV